MVNIALSVKKHVRKIYSALRNNFFQSLVSVGIISARFPSDNKRCRTDLKRNLVLGIQVSIQMHISNKFSHAYHL